MDSERNIVPAEHPDAVVEFCRAMSEAEKVRKRVGRNAPCPCGSGKKLKRCCLYRGYRR